MRNIGHSSEAKPNEYFIRSVSRGEVMMYAFSQDTEIQAKKYFMLYIEGCLIVGGEWSVTLYHRTDNAEGFYAPILCNVAITT